MTFEVAERHHVLREQAERFAATARETITRAYPVAVLYTAESDADLFTHRELHPAFYGSFDWHSCVEMHWALFSLIRRFPALPQAPAYRATLDALYAPEHLATDAAFFEHQRSFELPYGRGWFLMLFHEIAMAAEDDPDAARWVRAMAPLARVIEEQLVAWLPNLTWPVRHGVHGNTAFALARSLPYARLRSAQGASHLEEAIVASGRRWYLDDRDYPAQYEPSGNDFLSPALSEAELMADVLDPAEFVAWLDGFLPGLTDGVPPSFFRPVAVSDDSDGPIAHLHGLNLSRAWGWRRLAEALPAGDSRIPIAFDAAGRHAAAGLPFVSGSNYMVEHWLAAYAVLMLI